MWRETCERVEKKEGSEEVDVTMAEKKREFEEWLQRRERDTYERYRAQKAVVQAVKSRKEWLTGDGMSDCGMISREIKNVLERGKTSEEGCACKGRVVKGCE